MKTKMKLLCRALALMIIFSVMNISVTIAQDAGIKDAQKKLIANDIPGAIDILKQTVIQYPKSAEALYWLAFAHVKQNKYDDALKYAQDAAVIKPKLELNRALLVDLYLKKEKFAEALIECNFLLSVKTKVPNIPLRYAEILIGLDKFEMASTELAKMDAKKPKDVQIITLLGDVYAKQKINVLAIQKYKEALEIDPNSTITKVKLAKVHFKEQQYLEALKEYLEALKLDSNNLEANLNVGYIYYNGGKNNVQQYGFAIFYLQKYISLQPDDLLGYYYLGSSYHAIRNYKNAIEPLVKVAENDTGKYRIESLQKLGEAYMGLSDFYNVTLSYEKILAENKPLDAKEYVRLGQAYKALKDTANTIKYYSKSVELDSAYILLFHDIGMMFYSAKRYKEAMPWFEKRITLSNSDTTSASSWLQLGLSQFYSAANRKDTIAALTSMRKTVELKPSSTNYWIALAQISERADSLKWAKQAYEKAIGVDSTNAASYFGLGTLAYRSQKTLNEAITNFQKTIKWDEKHKYAHYYLAKTYMRKQKPGDAKKHYQKYLELDPTGPYSEDVKKELKKIP